VEALLAFPLVEESQLGGEKGAVYVNLWKRDNVLSRVGADEW